MSHYHDENDGKFGVNLRKGAPDVAKAFWDLNEAAMRSENRVIPKKYIELIALATALTTHCVYCIEAHAKAAAQEGATPEEISETVFIASALQAGAGYAHGFLAMKFHKQQMDTGT